MNKSRLGNQERSIKTGPREYVTIMGKAVLIQLVLAITFYNSLVSFIFLSPIGFLYFRYEEAMLCKKKYDQLRSQFKEALQTVASDMQAGYSFQRALEDAVEVCGRLYGKQGTIRNLLMGAVNEIEMNVPVEKALWNMAKECQIREVYEFEEVVRLTYMYGGNMPSMLRQLASSLEGRVSIREEILAVTASARYEAYVMDFIPPGIICYLNLTAPVFLEALYTTLWGRLFMTVCLLIYIAVVYWQFSMMKRGIT